MDGISKSGNSSLELGRKWSVRFEKISAEVILQRYEK